MTSEFFGKVNSDGERREKIGSIFIRNESDIVRVRDRVRLVARELGFDNITQIKLTTAVSELTRNIYEYAQRGSITVSLLEKEGRKGMEIVCEDNGPGIADLDRVLAGEFRSKTGLGKGITGSRRLMDDFSIESAAGAGTRVQAIKWFDFEQRHSKTVDQIRKLFFSPSESGMVEELQAQNAELIRVLGELTQSRREIEQTNHRLQEANDKLKRVDESKSRFISTIAHEVRTPLNAIIGLVQLLGRERDAPLTAGQREIVGRLEKSTSMLVNLVNDLLDLSRLQSGKMPIKVQSFDATELIDPFYRGLKQTASDKGVDFSYEIEEGLPRIESDFTKITQVITNLASNAIKFTPSGGSVKIHVSAEGSEMWRVEVTDTGIGMAEDQVPLIFEEFRQVNIASPHHGGGTGLGLPISKKLVELLGGRIEVESAPEQGSKFSVIWPLDVRGYVPDSLLSEA